MRIGMKTLIVGVLGLAGLAPLAQAGYGPERRGETHWMEDHRPEVRPPLPDRPLLPPPPPVRDFGRRLPPPPPVPFRDACHR